MIISRPELPQILGAGNGLGSVENFFQRFRVLDQANLRHELKPGILKSHFQDRLNTLKAALGTAISFAAL